MKNYFTPAQAVAPLKIVVIGGTGLIGTKVVRQLRALGHEAIPASPSTGINTLTGEGLAAAMAGAQVVVDVENSPSFEAKAVMNFFATAGRQIAAAEKAAGVKHHLALSVVGTDRSPENAYFLAKARQEEIIREAGIPFTIVRATQFFEFVGAIVQSATAGDTVRVPSAMMQPIAAEDVANVMTEATLAQPTHGIVDLAGPEKIRMNDLVRQFLTTHDDARELITDDGASFFGSPVDDRSLVPTADALLGKIRFVDWLERNAPAVQAH